MTATAFEKPDRLLLSLLLLLLLLLLVLLNCTAVFYVGRDSVVSDSLRPGLFGDRIPVGARFSARVHTGPEAHPDSCTMDTGSFLGLKRPGRVVDHKSPFSAEVKERAHLYIFPYGASCSVKECALPLHLALPLAYFLDSKM